MDGRSRSELNHFKTTQVSSDAPPRPSLLLSTEQGVTWLTQETSARGSVDVPATPLAFFLQHKV